MTMPEPLTSFSFRNDLANKMGSPRVICAGELKGFEDSPLAGIYFRMLININY